MKELFFTIGPWAVICVFFISFIGDLILERKRKKTLKEMKLVLDVFQNTVNEVLKEEE